MKKSIVTIIMFFSLFTYASADEWVTNWIDQSTISLPNSFQTEKRGYVQGGSLSVRYQQKNDHLVSFSPPSFKSGCGGIDMWFGGINYLNADRLMHKFEHIMDGALATYAFDLALNIFCTSCAKEVQTLESLMDRLNGLQMDDCKASKAVVAYMNDKTGQGDTAENTDAINDFMINSGRSQMYNDNVDSYNNWSANDVMKTRGFTRSDMVEGCPPEMQEVYFTSGSILDNVAIAKGIDTSQVKLIRGFIGDVLISDELDYAVVGACSENVPVSLDKIVYGEIFSREGDSGCVQAGEITIDGVLYDSFADWAETNISSIVDAIEKDTSLSVANISFLNTIPDPLYTQLVKDVNMYGNDLDENAKKTIVSKYIRGASIHLADDMFSTLLSEAINHLNYVYTVAINQKNSNAFCSTGLKRQAQEHSQSMLSKAWNISREFRSEYNSTFLEIMTQLIKKEQAAMSPRAKARLN